MKTEDLHSEFREQVIKYLGGEMQSDEKEAFEKVLSEDEEKNVIFSEYATIWEGVDRLAARDKYDLDEEWDAFSAKIVFEEKISKTISLRKYIVRIAAILIIGLSGIAGWYILRNTMAYEQVAMEEGREVIEMKDGSIVTLNEGSTLKYAIDDSIGKRKVILSGEAFFEVARDTLRPFIIEARSAVIEVLGTSFNVNAYKDNQIVEVTVNSGVVSLASKKTSDNLLILNKGNSGVYNKSRKELKLISRADPNAFAWKSKELIFSETPLSEVVRVINHVYTMNLEIEDEAISSCTITVKFTNQEFAAVLKVLVNTLDLQLERRDGKILLSGEGCD